MGGGFNTLSNIQRDPIQICSVEGPMGGGPMGGGVSGGLITEGKLKSVIAKGEQLEV